MTIDEKKAGHSIAVRETARRSKSGPDLGKILPAMPPLL
jgi:hypothetical protein